MTSQARRIRRAGGRLAVGALVIAVAGFGSWAASTTSGGSAPDVLPAVPAAEGLHRSGATGLIVPPDAARRMGLRTEAATAATRARALPAIQGCVTLDSNRLARVHARFAGEVVEVGQSTDGPATSEHPVRFGDRVRQGQVLAVVRSKDLGEKKSELVDAASKLKADTETLKRLEDLYGQGGTAERSVRDAARAVESDRVALERAERTLRSWQLTDVEIAAVRAEADRLSRPTAARTDPADWARVEVRAPRHGVVLEKNVAPGDLVDTTSDLFKVGDLSRLTVWVHVYEEDLPVLQALPRPIRWTVRIPSQPGREIIGTLDQIGAMIDPAQHTALVSGFVDNPDGALKVGQYVTATVEVAPNTGEVEVAAAAVVEDGRESVVFVRPPGDSSRFVRQTVRVIRRNRDVIGLAGGPGVLAPGDQVVTAGALLLNTALQQLPTPSGE